MFYLPFTSFIHKKQNTTNQIQLNISSTDYPDSRYCITIQGPNTTPGLQTMGASINNGSTTTEPPP